jgi:hypothetical protein
MPRLMHFLCRLRRICAVSGQAELQVRGFLPIKGQAGAFGKIVKGDIVKV